MASSNEYLEYILEQLSALSDITYRKMMGEYILYYRGRVFGGIYDNRLLLKPTASARELLPDASEELPYEGAKPMLMPSDTDDRELLAKVTEAMYSELPEPKKKK